MKDAEDDISFVFKDIKNEEPDVNCKIRIYKRIRGNNRIIEGRFVKVNEEGEGILFSGKLTYPFQLWKHPGPQFEGNGFDVRKRVPSHLENVWICLQGEWVHGIYDANASGGGQFLINDVRCVSYYWRRMIGEDKVIADFIKTCSTCRKNYRLAYPYQIHCSDKCREIDSRVGEQINRDLFNRVCDICGRCFRRPEVSSTSTTCDACKKEKIVIKYKESRPSEIEAWIKKKKRKGVSLELLIKRQEWKRVFDEHAWDHYLKGRKWDKI